MYPNLHKLVKNLAKPFYIFKRRIFAFNNVRPIMWPNWQVRSRTELQTAENVESEIFKMAANTKDCRCQQLPSHPNLLRFTFIQSNKSLLNSTKHKAMTWIGSEGWANELTSLDVISYQSSLAPNLQAFLRGKQLFLDGQNSRKFGRHILKNNNC